MGRLGPPESTHPSKETLSAYVDEELESGERLEVDRHLRDCSVCRATVAEYRRASDIFQRIPAQRVPLSLRRDLYRRIEAHERRRLPLGLPFPSANVVGLAVTAFLMALMAPHLFGMWDSIASRGRNPPTAAQPALPADSEAAPLVSPAAPPPPPATSPTAVPTAPAQGATPVPRGAGVPGPPPGGPSSAAAPSSSVGPQAGQPAGQHSGQPGAAATAARSAPATAAPAAPTSAAPTASPVPPTATTAAPPLRSVTGVIGDFNRSQRSFTVSAAAGPDGPARKWQVTVNEGTRVAYKDGRALRFEDIGVGDKVEVSGFETQATPGTLLAASLSVVESAVAQPPVSRPRVLFVLDSAESVRAPQFGFTGDWIKRLSDTGYDVTAIEPARLTTATNLSDFRLVVIGYQATLSDSALQKVKQSKLPILNADPRLVQPLGLGLNADPTQPTRMVSGRAIDVAGDASPVARGYADETVVANDTVYRTPIVSNGTVLASIVDGGQRRAVWSITGNAMYFGVWGSANGQNHNAAYWTLFDRSVLLLLGRDPLSVPAAR